MHASNDSTALFSADSTSYATSENTHDFEEDEVRLQHCSLALHQLMRGGGGVSVDLRAK